MRRNSSSARPQGEQFGGLTARVLTPSWRPVARASVMGRRLPLRAMAAVASNQTLVAGHQARCGCHLDGARAVQTLCCDANANQSATSALMHHVATNYPRLLL